MLNNVVEMRSDAFKLSYNCRRPRALKTGGVGASVTQSAAHARQVQCLTRGGVPLGVWLVLLQIMSVVAVLTNCAHIGITSRHLATYFPRVTDTGKVLAMFVFEVGGLSRWLIEHWQAALRF